MVDWGTGSYEVTAAEIAPTSDVVVAALAPRAGESVLDAGCGTGNAALLAARAGARVTGVDPAERLVGVARERSAAAGLDATFAVGDATALEFADSSFDAVISVFAVVFAADARAAASELVRVARPHGRILLTAWVPEGTIAALGRASAMAAGAVEPRPGWTPTDWSDAATVRGLFGDRAQIELAEHTLAFTAPSPQAMLRRFTDHHPLHLSNRAVLEPAGRWEALLAELGAILAAGNEDPAAFRTTSRYRLVTITPDPRSR